MRDFSLVFGGISATTPVWKAAWSAKSGPTEIFLNEGNQGLPNTYLDSLAPLTNQSHHYAGILFAGYYTGGNSAFVINLGRDIDPGQFNPGDIRLGTLAAFQGGLLRRWFWNITPQAIPEWIGEIAQ